MSKYQRSQKPDRAKCHYCRRWLKRKEITLDHKIPRVKGGVTIPQNILLACKLCNVIKSDTDYEVFIERIKLTPITQNVPLDNPILLSKYQSAWTKHNKRVTGLLQKYA